MSSSTFGKLRLGRTLLGPGPQWKRSVALRSGSDVRLEVIPEPLFSLLFFHFLPIVCARKAQQAMGCGAVKVASLPEVRLLLATRDLRQAPDFSSVQSESSSIENIVERRDAMDLEHLRDPRSSWQGGTPLPQGVPGPPNRWMHRQHVARIERYLNQAGHIGGESFLDSGGIWADSLLDCFRIFGRCPEIHGVSKSRVMFEGLWLRISKMQSARSASDSRCARYSCLRRQRHICMSFQPELGMKISRNLAV